MKIFHLSVLFASALIVTGCETTARPNFVNMSAAEMEYLMNCNQDAINCVLQDPGHVEAVSAGFEIDRRED